MELVIQGLLFGLGFLAALLLVAVVIVLVALLVLFLSYLAGKQPSKKNESKTERSE